MNRSIPLLSLTTLLLVGNASAQLPDWGSLPSAAPTMVFAEASIVVVEDALGIHAWSSYSRAWADLSVSAGAQFYGYDDHCVVLDGTMAWGFATRAGKWQPQPVTASASMSSSATGALWLSAVLDGNDVHTFSGLSGAWHTSQFAAAPTVAVARMVAVLSDGVRTVGISAHFGEPVELGPVGSVQLDAVGYCGIARSATACHVFGAYRNSWRTLPATAAATIVKPPSRAGYVVVREPGYMNFYSALTDNQVLLLADASATLSTQANVAAVQVGNTIFASPVPPAASMPSPPPRAGRPSPPSRNSSSRPTPTPCTPSACSSVSSRRRWSAATTSRPMPASRSRCRCRTAATRRSPA